MYLYHLARPNNKKLLHVSYFNTENSTHTEVEQTIRPPHKHVNMSNAITLTYNYSNQEYLYGFILKQLWHDKHVKFNIILTKKTYLTN